MLVRLVLAAAVLAGAQATFRSNINYVEVDAIVTDARSRFVSGLTADDFELVEGGKVQKVDFFTEVNLPIPDANGLAALEALPPSDVVTNQAAGEGRVFLIVLDDLHVTFRNTIPTRQAARRFVEGYVGPGDLAAVAFTSGRPDAAQDFTSSKPRLLAAINAFAGRGHGSAEAEVIENYQLKLPAGDRLAEDRVHTAKSAYEVIAKLAAYVSSIRGRRIAMVVFSEGVNVQTEGIGDPTLPTYGDMKPAGMALLDAISAATRANVHVYTVDPNRLGSPSLDARLQIPMDNEARAAGIELSNFDLERLRGQASLRTLAELTGGRALIWTNDFDAGFARMVRESSRYYLLGYSPNPSPREGRFQEIRVRVKRPGLAVRARPGYYAARRGTGRPQATGSRPLDALMSAAVPSDGLPMRVTTAAFRDKPGNAAVIVAVDLPPEAFQDTPVEKLTIVYSVSDGSRRVLPSAAQSMEIVVPRAFREPVATRGFRLVQRVSLPPGRYQARFAAMHGERRGSVFADVDVPDFFAAPLAWSGVSMTSIEANRTPAHAAGESAAKALPVPPAAVRRFARGDTVSAYAVAYGNGAVEKSDIDLAAVVRGEDGTTVFAHSEERRAADFRARRGLGLRLDIPTAGLAAGRYVLTIAATSRGAGRAPAWRDIPFEIY